MPDRPTGVKVGAVIVHFRFWPDIQTTLDAVVGQTRPPDELLVVDDCSGDGSVEALRAARPGLEVVVAPENRGVIASFNAGIEALLARGVDAVLMLTHETVMEPDVVERLVERLEQAADLGAVAPLLGFLSRPDVVFSGGGELLPRTWQNPHAGMYEPLGEWRRRGVRRVPWADGACLCVRAAALGDTGLLPERYFHYYDDVELGVKLNQAGWGVEVVCGAVARQEPGLLAEYYRVRNRLGFLGSTAPSAVVVRAIGRHLAQVVSDARSPRRRACAVAQLRALRDFALGRFGRAPRRYMAARRCDFATGGALLGQRLEPTWAMPRGG